jgi:hypothetical protein
MEDSATETKQKQVPPERNVAYVFEMRRKKQRKPNKSNFRRNEL